MRIDQKELTENALLLEFWVSKKRSISRKLRAALITLSEIDKGDLTNLIHVCEDVSTHVGWQSENISAVIRNSRAKALSKCL